MKFQIHPGCKRLSQLHYIRGDFLQKRNKHIVYLCSSKALITLLPLTLQRQSRGVHMLWSWCFASQCRKIDPCCCIQQAVPPSEHDPFSWMWMQYTRLQCACALFKGRVTRRPRLPGIVPGLRTLSLDWIWILPPYPSLFSLTTAAPTVTGIGALLAVQGPVLRQGAGRL